MVDRFISNGFIIVDIIKTLQLIFIISYIISNGTPFQIKFIKKKDNTMKNQQSLTNKINLPADMIYKSKIKGNFK